MTESEQALVHSAISQLATVRLRSEMLAAGDTRQTDPELQELLNLVVNTTRDVQRLLSPLLSTHAESADE